MGSSYLAAGYECNHECICCPLTTFDKLHRKISPEDILRRIENIPAPEEGQENHVVLSGGEPMLNPGFWEILDCAARKGFTVTVLTNATMCSNAAFAKRLAEYGQIDIVTAIHSSRPQIHDKMTGTPGSLLKTLEGLDNLVAEGVPVTVKHFFSRVTLPHVLDTFEYLEKHFPPQVGFQFCTMDYSGRAWKNREELAVSGMEIKAALENVLDFLESRQSRHRGISVIETPYCFADPYYWKYFSGSAGKLTAYIAPNLDDQDIAYEVDSDCSTDYEPCQRCAVKPYCSGVWKSAYRAMGDSIFMPVEAY